MPPASRIRPDVVGALRRPAPSPDDRERPLRRGQQLAHAREGLRRGPRCRAHHGRRVGRVGRLHQHVLGQREHDRPGAPAEGRLEGPGNELGNALGPVDLEHPLRQTAEHLLVVDLLEGLAAAMLARHLPDQQHERRRVLHRRVHTGRGMRRARPARDHADARTARQLAVGIRGVGGRSLVAAGDDAQPITVRIEAVEQREVALARHAEGQLDPLQHELVGEQVPAAPRHSSTGSSRKTV